MLPFSIKGFQGTSLIDYPGRIASIVFTGYCNFRCRFCYNRPLVEGDSIPDANPEDILGIHAERRGFIEGVVISGGEPTIQPGLIEFMRELRNINLDIKLDTNGSRPDILETIIEENLAEYIAMDYKAPLARLEQVACAQGFEEAVAQSAKLLISRAHCRYEFRTTVHPLTIDLVNLEQIADEISGAAAWFIQQYHAFDSIDPLLLETPPYLEAFFIEAETRLKNRFPVFGVRSLK